MARRSTTTLRRKESLTREQDLWLVCLDPSDKTVHLWVSEWTLMCVYVVHVTPVCCCLSAVHRIDSWTLTSPVSKSVCENWVTWISSPLKSEIVDSLVNSWRVSSCLYLISFFYIFSNGISTSLRRPCCLCMSFFHNPKHAVSTSLINIW